MLQFFHGWRRKAGVVTLVMACVMAVLWVRSCIVIDNFAVAIGDRRPQLALFRGGAYLEIWDAPKFRDTSKPLRVAPKYQWRVRSVGPAIQSDSWNLRGPTICVPFRHFVVVFTLLSAYLLLWKPRKRDTPKPQTSSVVAAHAASSPETPF